MAHTPTARVYEISVLNKSRTLMLKFSSLKLSRDRSTQFGQITVGEGDRESTKEKVANSFTALCHVTSEGRQ